MTRSSARDRRLLRFLRTASTARCWAAAIALVLSGSHTFSLGLVQSNDQFLAKARGKLWANFLLAPDYRGSTSYSFQCRSVRKKVKKETGHTESQVTTRLQEVFWTDSGPIQRVIAFERGQEYKTERRWGGFTDSLDARRLRGRIWEITKFEFLRSDSYRGVKVRVYSFITPDRVGKELSAIAKTSGQLWFDEEHQTLLRVEGEFRGTVILSAGGFASGAEFKKGTKWSWELRRTEDWIWVQAEETWSYPRRSRLVQDVTSCFNFVRLPE